VRIRAIFRGPAVSMGYVPGREHVLQVLYSRGRPRIVYAEPSGQPCPYGSWAAFWQQWEKAR
jgi:hypothetical protein